MNASKKEKLTVAAVADLHVREDGSADYSGLFAEMSEAADAIVVAGDLTDLGKPAEAKLVAKYVQSSDVPVVAVLGNHDHESGAVEEISAILREAKINLLDGTAVEIKGVGFAGVKGFAGGFGRHMLGSFGEQAIKAMVGESVEEAMRLENAIRQVRSERAMVVLHYAPVVETVVGEPAEIFPFLGSSRLAETIDRFPVGVVVHGHAHRGAFEGKTAGGVPVYNVAAHIEKPSGRPYALLTL
jgi:Icc-related predicted phosphoesterase